MASTVLGSLQRWPCSLVSNVVPISWERRWDLREGQEPARIGRVEGVRVERPDG